MPQDIAAPIRPGSSSSAAEEAALGLSSAQAERQSAPEQGSAPDAVLGGSLDAALHTAAAGLEGLSIQVIVANYSVCC